MAFWNGTQWVHEGPLQSPRRAHRLWGAIAEASLVTILIFGLIAGVAMAGKPSAPSGGCTVSDAVVSGWGLPNDTLMNFMVTDSSGTTGWVLGNTDTGTATVEVQAATGATTYEFASKTWGRHGSKYNVFASCSTTG